MFQLEKVFGITVNSNSALASNPKTDFIAYPAGSTVVLLNVATNEQHHIVNRSKKAIKSLDFTPCGKYLIFSEHGQNSTIKIWHIQGEIKQIAEIHPEDNGTRCFAISSQDNYIVTFGYNFSLSLWDFKKETKIGGSKISAEIKGISFAQTGKYFVTVGNKHIKYWYLENSTINGKSVALNDVKNSFFCDVACGKDRCCEFTYIVTKSGVLCMFNSERNLEKSIKLETGVNCLVVSENYVVVGFNEAIINCFDSLTLEHLFNLPKSHSLGSCASDEEHVQGASYPDTIAMAFCRANTAIVSFYNDHSLYIWNLENAGRTVTKSHCFLYHSNCIWDMKICPTDSEENKFLTCSSDNTMRSWTIDNLNSKEIICLDNNFNYLKNIPRDKSDLYYGIRCIGVSADGVDLSCGDRQGDIRIYKLQTMELQFKIGEHNLEVLCLDYTPLNSEYNLMVSAGKDKDICIYDVNDNYSVIQKINDHSSSVTTVKFGVSKENVLKIISSSNDGNCIVRSLKPKKDGSITPVTEYNVSLKAILYNVELDVDMKFIFMASQNLKIYDTNTRQIIKTLRPPAKGSFVFKVALDSSSKYIATSCLDKSVVVYDFESGNYLTTMYSNLVTNLCFTRDCQRLIAVTGDGCIFIWRIANENNPLDSSEESLPTWAKKLKTTNIVLSTKSTVPRGKWADRMENTISIKSSYISDESDASPQTPRTSIKPYFSEDSSILDKQIVSHEIQASTDTSLESGIQPTTMQPVKPLRRKLRKGNKSKDSLSSHSSSLESLNASKQEGNKPNIIINKTSEPETNKPNQEEVALNENDIKVNKPLISNVDSKIPIAVRRQNVDLEKREKANQMIQHVKEKLQNISKHNQLKSSTSVFDLSQTPPEGSWLLTYRTSFENQREQLRKRESLGDLTKNKYYSSQNINQLYKDTTNKTLSRLPKPISNTSNKQVFQKNKLPEKSQEEKEIISSRSDLNSQRNKPRLKLSLAKPQLLSRTGTDPQIILRRKLKNEKNIASMDKQLSASTNELNFADSFDDLNMSTVKLTEQLCERAGLELIKTATKAAELYRKFLNEDTHGSSNMNMIENLALSLVWAHIKLDRLNIRNK